MEERSQLKSTLFRFWKKNAPEVFGIDLRSLALFRIGLGFIVIVDILQRLRDLEAHYTDFGMFPRAAAIVDNGNFLNFSLHFLNGSWQVQAVIFMLGMFASFLMMIGYRSRLMTFLTWIFVVSLQNRIHIILHGADVLIRVLLFWCMFLPSGARYSVDYALAKEKPGAKYAVSLCSFILLLQICLMYWLAVVQRTHPSWHQDGTAVIFALASGQLATYWADLMLLLPQDLLKQLTWFTMKLELFGPMIAFIPFYNGYFRLFIFTLFTGMHITFGFLLTIGLFSPFACIGWFVFLPALFWELAKRAIRFETRPRVTLLFHEGNKAAENLSRILATLAFVAEEPKAKQFKNSRDLWALKKSTGEELTGVDALLALLEASRVYAPAAWIARLPLVLPFVRALYVFASSFTRLNERVFGGLQSIPIRIRPGVLVQILAVYFITMGILWALIVTKMVDLRLPMAIRWPVLLTRTDQKWSMFRNPILHDGWLVYPAELANGSTVDLYKGGPEGDGYGELDWLPPERISTSYRNWRWRKFLGLARGSVGAKYLEDYAGYICRKWNREHRDGNQLLQFQIVYMQRRIFVNGEKSDPKKRVLRRQFCFNQETQEALKQRWSPNTL